MSTLVEDNPTSPISPTMDEVSPEDLAFVNSEEFETRCKDLARGRNASSSDESSGEEEDLWSDSDETVSSATTVKSDPNEPSKIEQYLYYAGIRSPKGRGGPKLVWRDSPDTFHEPTGPGEYKRMMKVIPVQDDHPLGTKVSKGVIMWDISREHIVGLLKQENTDISSVDFVRFTWLSKRPGQAIDSDEEEEGESEQEDDDDVIDVADYDQIARIAPVEDGDCFVSNPTVWIGVIPDSLTATAASEVAKGIRHYLDGLD
ncbi:hypothetical protein FRC00_005643, partial [Tulasnella sp. 408]